MSYTFTITFNHPLPSTKKISWQETTTIPNGEGRTNEMLERTMEYINFIAKLPPDIVSKKIEHHIMFSDGKYLIDSQKVHFNPMDQIHSSIAAVPINGKFYTIVPSSQIDNFRPVQYHQPIQNALQLID